MLYLVLILAILVPGVFIAGTFLLTRHFYRQRLLADDLSPVSRQHIELFQGGQLNEEAVESAKTRFRELLEKGEVQAVEASLRPGTHFVIQVRALTELGTEDAGLILERQLQRRLTDDQIEQSWYWIDLANGLRSLNRSESLPHLLRRAETAPDIPLGNLFAAETVCFLNFAGFLRQIDTPLGRAALRVLHRTMTGLRNGLPPQVVIEGRLGELVDNLWDHLPENPDPLLVQIFAETLRLAHRAGHGERVLAGETPDLEAFRWQMSRMAALEPLLVEYLHDAKADLCGLLPKADTDQQGEILQALVDLRADVGQPILDLLAQRRYPHAPLAVEALTWSRHADVGPFLRTWIMRRLSPSRRTQYRRQARPPARPSVPADFPYEVILQALRGHPSFETEAALLLAVHDWDPTFRAAAFSSLGWWEPCHRVKVLLHLQEGRCDPNPTVRQYAQAALARLGERRALQYFRQGLNSADPGRAHDFIQMIATEGLALLWPDLDRLADSEDVDISFHAREALECLGEDMERERE